MSTVDTNDTCPTCLGSTGFRTPQCSCPDRKPTVTGPSMGCLVEGPPKPLACPKCKSEHRVKTDNQEGVHIFCHDCGFMERDTDSYPYQMKVCRSCGRVPKAVAYADMPEENTLDTTYMTWQCCGIREPVWPSEILFWCHMYIAQEGRK